jgi:hypothetical protein
MTKTFKIGDKMRGFVFYGKSKLCTYVPSDMDKFVGVEGTIDHIFENGVVRIRFPGDELWCYPGELVAEHLVKEDEERPINWKAGQDVWCLCRGKGKVHLVYENGVRVKYDAKGDCGNYDLKGCIFDGVRTLYFSEPVIIAQRNPAFVPKIEPGTKVVAINKTGDEVLLLTVGEEKECTVICDEVHYSKDLWSFREVGKKLT